MSNPKWRRGSEYTTLHMYLTEKVLSSLDNSCWSWPGTHSSKGYPMVRVPRGKVRKTATVAYELRYGAVPVGTELDHLCRSKGCWNPKHLEPVTHAENMARAVMPNSLKEVCSQGHLFDVANTYYGTNPRNSNLWRKCRACHRERARIGGASFRVPG